MVQLFSSFELPSAFEAGHWEQEAGYSIEGRVKPKKYYIVDLQEHRFIESAEVTDF